MNQLITTSDGSHTLYVPELDEHYHSVYGAVQESNHIFISNGFDFCKAQPINIFEVGFGTGLNALLTAVKSRNEGRKVNFTTIEKYPINEDVTCLLNHYMFAGNQGKEIAGLIYGSEWNTIVKISDSFNLMKIRGDLKEISLDGTYDLIYFDAFGPDKQPEMWTTEIFEKIAEITKKDGVFVTYSAKGDVKRKLKACGFNVSLLPGPPGKRQMIRAVKN